jgi:hypothetical protein
MTPKQIERVKNKIKLIKSELAKDKKVWGGQYHDGRGLRYIPTSLYIQIGDISGGLRYVNWFDKNFPDDIGSSFYIFESILILYKSTKTKEAELKLRKYKNELEYILDLYFKKVVDKNFIYEFDNEELIEFSKWLKIITKRPESETHDKLE